MKIILHATMKTLAVSFRLEFIFLFALFVVGEALTPSGIASASPPGATVCWPLQDYIKFVSQSSQQGKITAGKPGPQGIKGDQGDQGDQGNPGPKGEKATDNSFYLFMSPKWLLNHAEFFQHPSTVTATSIAFSTDRRLNGKLFRVRLVGPGQISNSFNLTAQLRFQREIPKGDSDIYVTVKTVLGSKRDFCWRMAKQFSAVSSSRIAGWYGINWIQLPF
eukprot:m.199902 g.199902  ORF g.199902 m.199902 type:complete len:220 (+) comp39581_c1_seq11:373-1032(+)